MKDKKREITDVEAGMLLKELKKRENLFKKVKGRPFFLKYRYLMIILGIFAFSFMARFWPNLFSSDYVPITFFEFLLFICICIFFSEIELLHARIEALIKLIGKDKLRAMNK